MSIKEMSRIESLRLFTQSSEIIPGGVNSPVRALKGIGVSPVVVDRGEGDSIVDVDGNTYIDYCCSWGPLIHGHSHPEIVAAIQKQVEKGSTFGALSPLEEKIARKIIANIPSIEKIRFVSSGTEATMSAIRVARGFTERKTIVKFSGNYHGHSDALLVSAGSGMLGATPTSTSLGIPDETIAHTISLPYNDVETCRDFLLDSKNRHSIAAIIIEPIAGNMGCVPATHDFLLMLREVSLEIGAVLIFDEIITGFRIGLGGAQAHYEIAPDLTCLGKIIGGGFPAAAFGGKADIMNLLAPMGGVYQAGTLSGNPVAMAAGLKTIELLEKEGTYKILQEKANLITKDVQDLIHKKRIPACIQQVGSMFTLFFGKKRVTHMGDALGLDNQKFAHFFAYMLSQGIYLPPAHQEVWFVSTAHKNENLIKTRDCIINYLSKF